MPAPARGEVQALGGLPGSSKAFLLAALREKEQPGILLCCTDEIEVESWLEDLLLFSPERAGRPAPRTLPELERDQDARPLTGSMLARQSVLQSLRPGGILITDLASLMAPVAPPSEEAGPRLSLAVGQQHDPRALLALCRETGLRRVPQVLVQGEVSLRGDVLDIYAPGAESPIRLEFFDEDLESIRRFDPGQQTSQGSLEEILIALPRPGTLGTEAGEDLSFPLDLLDPAETIVVVVEPVRFEEHFSRFTLLAGTESAPVAAFRKGLKKFAARSLSTLPVTGGINLGFEAPHLGPVDRADLKGRLLNFGHLDDEILVLLRSEPEVGRLHKLAREYRVGKSVHAMVGSLARGFRIPALHTLVLNHGEFFGTGVAQRRIPSKGQRTKIASKALESFFELSEGDLVVHAVHGIARFVGMEQARRSQGVEDHLRLRFAEDIEVLVPASKIDLIQKYVGSGNQSPRLDKLGGKSFAKRKTQVAQALQDMAADLLDVQIQRAKTKGFACPKGDELTEEFVASFAYEDTPDQKKSSEEVEEDLCSGRPMDRLLCGDVGFGKTEIAMRAAFRMVSAGKQVAVLVPTTLLAEQHGRTFRDRMATFPIRCEVYSRLQSSKEKKEIREALIKGEVDILIGTHAILGRQVLFQDLGLLVVDEEQRFGVAHKEKIRQMRAEVHVLTLTATPIPRTLHMSLLGIKDISSLATPPPGRLEISTKVAARSSKLIRDAIMTELQRGGQIFFLHNRVQTLDFVEQELARIVPECKVITGHGQMGEKELLGNMRTFLSGEADLLLSTTIVQSGLDIPRANTILVDSADHFGLSELHQLRGRVGRDITHAHCFLMHDPTKPMTREGRSRLQAMERFSGLGSGFSLAMKDLEIRGAGNLLGPEQSGHIAAIGYDMYCKLLQAAVDRTHGGDRTMQELPEVLVSQQVDVDLGVDAYLPADLVDDSKLRLQLLREMDEAHDEASHDRIRADLEDRFGRLPAPLSQLLELFLLKHLVGRQGMSAARFLPPEQIVLSHPVGRGPQGQWLEAFMDVRPVRPDRTHLILPPHAREPERIPQHLKDALLGRTQTTKIRGSTTWEPAKQARGRRRRRP